jgi:hypothetical protein
MPAGTSPAGAGSIPTRAGHVRLGPRAYLSDAQIDAAVARLGAALDDVGA